MTLKLQSTAFFDGDVIPEKYTCDGGDRSPPLSWSGVPAETQSLVLVCTDPDAPRGTWHHWVVYDIPANAQGLAEDDGAARAGQAFAQAVNDFGNIGYGGPCPPRGHGVHHYHFRLSALDVPRLAAPPKSTCKEILALAGAHEIAAAELVGLYERKG